MKTYNLNHYSKIDLYKKFQAGEPLFAHTTEDGEVELSKGNYFINGRYGFLLAEEKRSVSREEVEGEVFYWCAGVCETVEEGSKKETVSRILLCRNLFTEYGEAIFAARYLVDAIEKLYDYLKELRVQESLPNIGEDIESLNEIEKNRLAGSKPQHYRYCRDVVGNLNYILSQYDTIKVIAERYGYELPPYESASRWSSPNESHLPESKRYEARLAYLSEKAIAGTLTPDARDKLDIAAEIKKVNDAAEAEKKRAYEQKLKEERIAKEKEMIARQRREKKWSAPKIHLSSRAVTGIIFTLIGIAGIVGGIFMFRYGFFSDIHKTAGETDFFESLWKLLVGGAGAVLVFVAFIWIIVTIKSWITDDF